MKAVATIGYTSHDYMYELQQRALRYHGAYSQKAAVKDRESKMAMLLRSDAKVTDIDARIGASSATEQDGNATHPKLNAIPDTTRRVDCRTTCSRTEASSCNHSDVIPTSGWSA